MTRVLRETMTPTLSSIIYCQYILSREEEWCKEPHSAPDWWSGKERGQPRFMEELMVIDSCPLRIFFKNWLWEVQVWEIFVSCIICR